MLSKDEVVKHGSGKEALDHFLEMTERKLEGEQHWMAVVWTCKDGKIYMDTRTTFGFRPDDFIGAVGLLASNLHEETLSILDRSALASPPPPLPKANLRAGCPKSVEKDDLPKDYACSNNIRPIAKEEVVKEMRASHDRLRPFVRTEEKKVDIPKPSEEDDTA